MMQNFKKQKANFLGEEGMLNKEIETMKHMYFHDGTFTPGKHLTVRKGDDWHKLIETGDFLAMHDIETGHITVAQVLETDLMKFANIPESMFSLSSNTECRTKHGALHSMKSIYKDFHEEEEVSIVFFKV